MKQKLNYSSLPLEIKKIANESLGLGVLKSLFRYSKTYHLMIKISDGVFIGFSLYHFEKTKMSNGESYIKGIIDCVCVATAYRKEGFGTLLTFGTLRKMSAYGANRIEIMLKKPTFYDRDGEPGVPLIGSEKLLQTMGFEKTKTYDNYFIEDSIKHNYDCLSCGNKPDSCSGVLYSINDNDQV